MNGQFLWRKEREVDVVAGTKTAGVDDRSGDGKFVHLVTGGHAPKLDAARALITSTNERVVREVHVTRSREALLRLAAVECVDDFATCLVCGIFAHETNIVAHVLLHGVWPTRDQRVLVVLVKLDTYKWTFDVETLGQ